MISHSREREDYASFESSLNVRHGGETGTKFTSFGLNFTLRKSLLAAPYLALAVGYAAHSNADNGTTYVRLNRSGMMWRGGAGIEWRLPHHALVAIEASKVQYVIDRVRKSDPGSTLLFTRYEWGALVGVHW